MKVCFRTQRTLAALHQRGQHVRVAVLACSDATDVASVACRAQLAHELLSAVTAAGFGRLVLSSAERASMPLRRELLSLADTLTQTVLGASVRVRFNREVQEGISIGQRGETADRDGFSSRTRRAFRPGKRTSSECRSSMQTRRA